MASASVVTSTSSITLICECTTSIVGTYPNLVFRFNYNFKLSLSNSQSYISGAVTFNFHTNNHNVTLPYIQGPTTTGALASGVFDLPFGTGRTCTHAPGYGIAFSWGGGASSTLTASQTIPAPTVSAELNSVSATSILLNINMSNNPYGFYRIDIWRKDPSGSMAKVGSSVANGVFTDSSVKPETAYVFNVEAWAKSNNPNSRITLNTVNAVTLSDQADIWIKNGGIWEKGKLWTKVNGEWVKVKKIFVKSSEWNSSKNA